MTHVNLDQVLEQLFGAATLLSDLLSETRGNERLERSLAAVDLMVSSGIREVHQGRRVNRASIVILGSIRGYNRAALGNLEGLLRLDAAGVAHPVDFARPFAPRLKQLSSLIHDSAEDPVPAPEVVA